jgi:hypothetical protein
MVDGLGTITCSRWPRPTAVAVLLAGALILTRRDA